MAPIIYTLWINWMVQLAASGEGLQAKLPLDDLVEQCHVGIRCWFDTDLTHCHLPESGVPSCGGTWCSEHRSLCLAPKLWW